MTDRITELKRLADNTPSGWISEHTNEGSYLVIPPKLEDCKGGYKRDMNYDDARFAAAARTAIPDLIAQIEKLEGALHVAKEWMPQTVELAMSETSKADVRAVDEALADLQAWRGK